jgi:hypothetical protein
VNHRGDLDRYRRGIDTHRNEWTHRHNWGWHGDPHHNDPIFWRNRFNVWWDVCPRPVYVRVTYVWWVPMPPYGAWDYVQVETVAENLEYLSEKIYDTMADPNVPYVNPAYQQRLMQALADLVGAAHNYEDAVRNSVDWDGSLNDLFFMEQQLSLVEQTLSGFSQEYRVQPDVAQFRYYVDELLWQYHQVY